MKKALLLWNQRLFSVALVWGGLFTNLWAIEIKSWQISAPYTLGEDVVAQDIICNHSKLIIQAEVTGQVFALGCDVTVGQNSLLHRGLFFSGGQVAIEAHADIFGDITQVGGDLRLDPSANLQGAIQRFQQAQQPPGAVSQASTRYLTFPRVVPETLEHLQRAAKELQFQQITEKTRIPLENFALPNFLDFLFKKEQIRFAQKWLYEKNGFPIELQMVEFATHEQALQFWKNILTFTNLNMEHSVQNSLGDGGHWFFRFQNRSSLLWHRTTWLISAQVYATSGEEDLPQWNQAEQARDELIQLWQKALAANTSRLDKGDMWIDAAAFASPKQP